jgi:hypothetical protein
VLVAGQRACASDAGRRTERVHGRCRRVCAGGRCRSPDGGGARAGGAGRRTDSTALVWLSQHPPSRAAPAKLSQDPPIRTLALMLICNVGGCMEGRVALMDAGASSYPAPTIPTSASRSCRSCALHEQVWELRVVTAGEAGEERHDRRGEVHVQVR